jgi:lysozyme
MAKLPLPGVELIKEFEGCRLKAYPDPLTGNKPITIGWGSTKKMDGGEWRLGDAITQQQADELLIHQLENHYLPSLQKIPCWSELNENQQGALLSFGYNLGANFYGRNGFKSITRVLNDRDWLLLPAVLPLYCNPGSNVEKGLKRRRLAEVALFLK